VEISILLSLLRRLALAKPGQDALHLPADITPREALQAIRAAIRVLEPPGTPSPPPAGRLGAACVHIDGASRGNPGPAGIGVLILGADGEVVERLHRGIGEATNNVAEYRALLLGLERTLALGVEDLEVRSDSELLVRQLQGRYRVKHPGLLPLYEAARKQIARFRHFEVRHVPREQNAEADALANEGVDEAVRVIHPSDLGAER
jgi:ribonuclease HI